MSIIDVGKTELLWMQDTALCRIINAGGRVINRILPGDVTADYILVYSCQHSAKHIHCIWSIREHGYEVVKEGWPLLRVLYLRWSKKM